MKTIRCGIGAAAALVCGALLGQATETPLARLEGGEKIGWDGVTLGLSSVQAERRTGQTFAMRAADPRVPSSSCQAYTVEVERDTLRLTLGFPSAKPGAKLQSIFVHFEGYQVTAHLEALVAELKSRFPRATYLPGKDSTAQAEASDARPAFLLSEEGGFAARLLPGDGLWLTLRSCVD